MTQAAVILPSKDERERAHWRLALRAMSELHAFYGSAKARETQDALRNAAFPRDRVEAERHFWALASLNDLRAGAFGE